MTGDPEIKNLQQRALGRNFAQSFSVLHCYTVEIRRAPDINYGNISGVEELHNQKAYKRRTYRYLYAVWPKEI